MRRTGIIKGLPESFRTFFGRPWVNQQNRSVRQQLIQTAMLERLDMRLLFAGSNALDRIDFGTPASESAHAFDAGFSSLPKSGTGAYGLTYREPVGTGVNSTTSSQAMTFTVKVDSTKQNYLTIKLWGNDVNGGQFSLLNAPNTPALDMNGGPPAYPNRFFYETVPIPISWTTNKTSVSVTINSISYYDGYGGTGTNYLANGQLTRPVYSAFTHTDPQFIPDSADQVGVKPATVGQKTPTALSSSQVISVLQTQRQAIYGAGGYYDSLLTRQIMPGQAGAPPETVGLDLWTNVSNFGGTAKTADQWRDQVGGGQHGVGYSTVPGELVDALSSTYLLQPFKDASGNVVTGLDHYHDASVLQRLVYALDGSTYLQAGDGNFNNNADNGNGNVWQGLTSSPRASGHAYAGSTARGAGWTISLEGIDTQALGSAIIRILNDPIGGPKFQAYLSQSYDANLNGGSVLRATAYERMLYQQVNYLQVAIGGTEAQNMMETVGMYSAEIALQKLQALYPNSSYPVSSTPLNIVKQVMGLSPDTQPGIAITGYTNYGLSKAGIGETNGALASGYDGRYGTILPWVATQLAQLSTLDANLTSATDKANLLTTARATINAYDQFISAQENFNGVTDNFTMAQEDTITYRNTYNANADSGSNYFASSYQAADSNGAVGSPLARRSAYLEVLYGVTPRATAAGGVSLQNLRDYGSYESTLRGLINVDPSTLTALPGEPGQPNHAWVDPQTGATAIYYNGERLYMNAKWDTVQTSGSPQVNGVFTNVKPTFIARIHDTTDTIDRVAQVMMPHDSTTVQSDGNLSGTSIQNVWYVRYGDWLIAGNPTTASKTVKLPAGTGVAVDVITGQTYALGTTVTLAAGATLALNLPVVTSAQPIANGVYTLTNVFSNQRIDDPNGSSALATQMVQNPATTGTNQQWTFTANGSGYYTITNVASGANLDAPGGTYTSGPLQIWTASSTDVNQLWQLIPSGNGFILKNKGTGLVADDAGRSTTPRAGLVIDAQAGGNNQAWTIASATLPPAPLANGTYTLKNQTSSLQMESPVTSATPGSIIDQAAADGTDKQKWVFTYNNAGGYTIRNVQTGLYLTADGNVAFGNGLLQQTASGTTNQLWNVVVENGGYCFVNVAYGYAIDDTFSSLSSGNRVDVYGFNVNSSGSDETWSI